MTASYGMGVNYVSPNDVADAAVVVLLNQKPYRNKVFNLTGPGPIKDSEVAKLLTKHYGTEIDRPINNAENPRLFTASSSFLTGHLVSKKAGEKKGG